MQQTKKAAISNGYFFLAEADDDLGLKAQSCCVGYRLRRPAHPRVPCPPCQTHFTKSSNLTVSIANKKGHHLR